jgi:hypothetical protein
MNITLEAFRPQAALAGIVAALAGALVAIA